MKKKLGDLTIRELDEYCHNTSCKHCEFRKENSECYNLQDLFNEMDFYDRHELEFEVKENMEDIKIKELKENVVKVFNAKSQVVQYLRRYDFDQANTLIITKIKDNYIVKKVWEQDEAEEDET